MPVLFLFPSFFSPTKEVVSKRRLWVLRSPTEKVERLRPALRVAVAYLAAEGTARSAGSISTRAT